MSEHKLKSIHDLAKIFGNEVMIVTKEERSLIEKHRKRYNYIMIDEAW